MHAAIFNQAMLQFISFAACHCLPLLLPGTWVLACVVGRGVANYELHCKGKYVCKNDHRLYKGSCLESILQCIFQFVYNAIYGIEYIMYRRYLRALGVTHEKHEHDEHWIWRHADAIIILWILSCTSENAGWLIPRGLSNMLITPVLLFIGISVCKVMTTNALGISTVAFWFVRRSMQKDSFKRNESKVAC